MTTCHCGATYSPVLKICPNCNESPIQPPRKTVKRKYLCGKGYLCTQGGMDGVCCFSCHRFDYCKEPCNKAELVKKMRDEGFKPDRCEGMIGGEEEEAV